MVLAIVDIAHVGPFLLFSILAGALGTGAMTLFLYVLTKAGVSHAPMVVAVGSLFTRSKDTGLAVGTLVHSVSGVIFGVIYTTIVLAAAPLAFGTVVLMCFGFGFIHGLMVCFFLVAAIAEQHPLEEFRNAGFSVGFAHLIGHLIFGIVVGLTIALSGIATP